MTIPNYVRDFKGFIANCGIYLKGQDEVKFVTDVLGIVTTNIWNTSRREGTQKRKFLVYWGNKWKYVALPKSEIENEISFEEFKDMLHEVIKPREQDDNNIY